LGDDDTWDEPTFLKAWGHSEHIKKEEMLKFFKRIMEFAHNITMPDDLDEFGI
jgi:hypothetical protein